VRTWCNMVRTMTKRKRNPRINFEVTKEEKKEIKKFAEKHNRTMSNLLRHLMIYEIKKGR